METTTQQAGRLSFASEADIDEFVAVLNRFERGEIGPDQWRAFRLVRGLYGQRQEGDAQMLRVKIPQGVLTAPQLEALADVAERYSRGFAHITTRQNVQFHFLTLDDVEPAMRRLAVAGLTTRESCGNSVRNITACPYAGVAVDEIFDVTPYAEALTRYLLRHPLSSSLPRKFKIAFEGCAEDHASTAINDIGWTAQVRQVDGRPVRGFRVTVAGGTSTMTRAGHLLSEFLPASDVFTEAEAILRVFHRLGDYAHKQRNRLKFLVRSLGWDGFRAELERELEIVRAEGGVALPFDPDRPPEEGPRVAPRREGQAVLPIAQQVLTRPLKGPGILPQVQPRLTVYDQDLARWMGTNVKPQRQEGWATVTVTLPLGDLTGAQMRVIADLSDVYADGTARTTNEQNLIFRWVRHKDVRPLYHRLLAAGLAGPGAGTLADVTSCPGAESCRLAVTQSRGLGRFFGEYFEKRPDLVDAAAGLHIKISGCPNGCGQHHVAGIGFQGSLRKVSGKPAPHYFVMIGGGTLGGETTFGRHIATIPARRTGEAVERLVRLYNDKRTPDESALAFFRRVDAATARAALDGLERLTAETATAVDFVDLGDDAVFDPAVGEGECSA
jgi:sulfite reductase (NADPH) hemoprotein beta-component